MDLLFSWEEKILKQVGAGQSTFFFFFSFFNVHECFSPKSVYHVYTWCPRRPEEGIGSPGPELQVVMRYQEVAESRTSALKS